MKLTHNGWDKMWSLWGHLLLIALLAYAFAWAKSKAINASLAPTIAVTAIVYGLILRNHCHAWLRKYPPSFRSYSIISLIWVLWSLTTAVGLIIADTKDLFAIFIFLIMQSILYITIIQLLDYILDIF